MSRTCALVVATALCGAAPPAIASGQSLLPVAGEGSVSVSYQNVFVKDHINKFGVRTDRGRINANSMLLGFEYGLTDRVTIDGDVVWVTSRYDGPFQDHGPLDDGRYHSTLQDARFSLRYAWLDGPLALAPFVGAVLPTHAYETVGHSAAGRNIRELQAGISGGMPLGGFLSDAYVGAQYAFALAQPAEGFQLNRSNVEAEFGYLVTHSFSAQAIGSWQWTYDGTEIPLVGIEREEHQHHHDRMAKSSYFRAGGGIGYALNRKVEIHGTVITTVSGRNGHATRSITIGTTWNFGRPSGFAASPSTNGRSSTGAANRFSGTGR